MKPNTSWWVALTALCLSILAPASRLEAATLSVSPPTVSTAYTGAVSLSITGLTPGKTIQVERFLDENNNGAIDPGERLTFRFRVTDGQQPFIGGVRNPNVPGDDDGAADGAVRIDLPFPNLDSIFGTVVSRHIFRLSDPNSGFPPVAAVLNVQAQNLPQGVSGRVTGSGAPLARVFVILVTASGGNPIGAVLTDANGNYSLPTPPGPFGLVVIANGFLSDENAGLVTVPPGQVATRNLNLASGNFIVSGKVSDSANGVGLVGVFVHAESNGNLFTGGLTDVNGNYSIALSGAGWRFGPSTDSLAQLGRVAPQGTLINAPASGSATIDFSAPKATALVYGRVLDADTSPVPGLQIEAQDQGNVYNTDGLTFFPNGNFATGLLPGAWQISPHSDHLSAKGYTGGTGENVILGAGEAVEVNFTVNAITARLRGRVTDDAGAPIPNIQLVVSPLPQNPSGAGSIYPPTDNNGNFDVGVRGGNWTIALECEDAQQRRYVNVSGSDFAVTDGVDQNNIALSYPVATATITGMVTNNQGQPIRGVTLDANQQINATSSYFPGCVETDANGNYLLRVLNGTWAVAVRGEELNARGFAAVPGQNVTIVSGTAIADFSSAPLPPEITSPLAADGMVGVNFVYQFRTRHPQSNRSATNLPPGLRFEDALSAIVGQPTTNGTFPVALTASNSSGTATATLNITIRNRPASGPVITSATSATGRTGGRFTFQVVTTGASSAARLTATNLPDGLAVDPVTGLIFGTPTTDGSTNVTLTVTDGPAVATGGLQLTFSSDPALPIIVSPSGASLSSGQPFNYTISAPANTVPDDPTQFDLIGTLPDGLNFDPSTGTISGTPTLLASAHGKKDPKLSGGVISNVQLFATNSAGTTTIPLIFFLRPPGIANISTRLSVGAEPNVLIGGFIITGNAPKKVIVRAIAPSLNVNGVPVPGALLDTTLELVGSGISVLNDDWQATQEQEIIDTTVPPTDNRESAMVALLNPGAYTAIVRGKNGALGIGLIEIFDLGTASLDAGSDAKLANISTRGFVQTNDDVMIGGFIITGANTRVLARAIGPDLTNRGVPGALQDPTLELRNATGDLLASNDDWRSTQESDIIATTVPPNDNRESALIQTLPPGGYTAIVRGKDATTGVGLVEVYALQ